jgi:hypothetical protein
LVTALISLAQSEPKVFSVTPADGATGVATNNTTVVFVFDQDMDTQLPPFPSFPPALIGNVELLPSSLFFSGSWGADKRTLTFKTSRNLPFYTTISWTLNPPGGTIVQPLASASHQVLPTVSGSFRTEIYVPPIPPPKLVSVTPTNNATDVSASSPVVFVFDQAMDTSTPLQASAAPILIGNYDFYPANISALFSGSWSADMRTLTFQPLSSFPFGTFVTWTLNPSGTTVPLKSTNGEPLALTSGNYRILMNTGSSNPTEVCPNTNGNAGYYTLTKTLAYSQTSANDVTPAAPASATFAALVQSPSADKGPTRGGGFPGTGSAGTVTNASITWPDGQRQSLTNQLGRFILYGLPATEAALESTYPPGIYTLRLDQTGEPEHVIDMAMPASPASIPQIVNYAEAQNINPSQGFTLRWDAFSPQGPGAFVNLIITDEFGNVIFQAPNPCVPRTLAPTDMSVVIPPNYFRADFNYTGTLQFGSNFYTVTNAVPGMIGYGVVTRTTTFALKTGHGGGAVTPYSATFTSFSLLPNGHPQMNLSAAAGQSYTILRTGTLTSPSWAPASTVHMSASGTGVFEDTDNTLTLPAFYKAALLGASK